MNITVVNIDQIHPYDRNPRVNDKAIDAVAASLQEFGFRQPIVVDADNIIIAGHTRWKAAQKLGLKKVPVHVATELTPEQVRAYRIADNRTNEFADWDYQNLNVELDALPIELADVTGFTQGVSFTEIKDINMDVTDIIADTNMKGEVYIVRVKTKREEFARSILAIAEKTKTDQDYVEIMAK